MDRRRSLIIIALLAASISIAMVVLLGATGAVGRLTIVILVTVIGVTLVAVVAAMLVSRAVRRASDGGRPSKADEAAARNGLAYLGKGGKETHREFGPLPGIPHGGDVPHLLAGPLDGRELTIFQHSYVINTGQAVIPVHHAAYLTTAPDWPAVTVRRRSAVGRLLFRLGFRAWARRGLLLEDEAFNATMRVKTDDEDFALTLLHPDMQRFFAENPSVTWHVHPGWCAMIYGGALRFDRIDASLDRLRHFWSLVPEELEAW